MSRAVPHRRQLDLFAVRAYGRASTGGQNRRLRDSREAASLAKCDRILAEQMRRELPPIRRCDICGGREFVATPHQHGATKDA